MVALESAAAEVEPQFHVIYESYLASEKLLQCSQGWLRARGIMIPQEEAKLVQLGRRPPFRRQTRP